MNARTGVVIGMVLLAALTRLIPHWPNFSAITALALFGAAYVPNRKAAFVVPLLALLLSDLALELATRAGLLGGWLATGQGFYRGMWVVYGAVALIAALGFVLRTRKSAAAVAGVTLSSSVLFFLVTNCPFLEGHDLYPATLEGLWTSYVTAIPFFRWTLLGDLLFVTVLFGGFALAEKRIPALARSAQ